MLLMLLILKDNVFLFPITQVNIWKGLSEFRLLYSLLLLLTRGASEAPQGSVTGLTGRGWDSFIATTTCTLRLRLLDRNRVVQIRDCVLVIVHGIIRARLIPFEPLLAYVIQTFAIVLLVFRL